MIIDVKNIRQDFYEVVIKTKVLVLVSYDVDAICAVRILQFLFETDNVQYVVIPVGSAEEMKHVVKSHRAKNSVTSLVLVNFGAAFDVLDELEQKDIDVFVLDSHRPIDLYNVYNEGCYVICRPEDNRTIPDYEELFREDEEDEDVCDTPEMIQFLERRANVLWHYQGTSYFGDSVAMTLFKLAWKLSRDSNQLLWLAVIGVCDQWVNHKIDSRQYDSSCDFLTNHVSRLGHLRSERNGGALSEIPIDSDNISRNQSLSIQCIEDLQLSLYRHWSLFESLRHTSSVCAKFKVWTPTGHKRLLEFLAELGVPLTQSKQRFASMDMDFKKNVQLWIKEKSEKYELEQLLGPSFVASRGYKSKYCATDVALAIRAIIESPDKEKTTNSKFLEALDALSWTNTDLLDVGLELSRVQFVAILKQVQHLLDMHEVRRDGELLCCVIRESSPDARIFSYPATLMALARFLLPAYVSKTKREQAKKDPEKMPLLIIAPDLNRPGCGFAAGIPHLKSKKTNNFFSEAFRQIADSDELEFELVPTFYDKSVVRFPFNENYCGQLIATVSRLLRENA